MATSKDAKDAKVITINPIEPKYMRVKIIGQTDLVLNKMNDVNSKTLIAKQTGQPNPYQGKEPNPWEQIITAIHWRDGKPDTDPDTWDEETMRDLLKNNAPCITAFGLYKSFGDAIVRNAIDKYATKFRASVNILAPGGLVPIKFAQHLIDEKLMSPTKGSPVHVLLNRFTGWTAEFDVSYVDNAYSQSQIVSIINLAGFGIGIGSGRTSGYGRYQIEGAK